MNNIDLADFFTQLSRDLKNKKVNEKQLQHLGEFYISYKFKNNKKRPPVTDTTFPSEKLMKYVIMGWYIYTSLENIDTPPSSPVNDILMS